MKIVWYSHWQGKGVLEDFFLLPVISLKGLGIKWYKGISIEWEFLRVGVSIFKNLQK